MEERQITGQESLELIARMLRNTQRRFERYAGMPFIVWGYATVAVSIAVWLMVTRTGNADWNFLWFGIIPLGAAGMFLARRRSEKTVTTYTDEVVGYIWKGVGFTAVLVSLASIFGMVSQILFIEALLINTGTAVTGMAIKLKYVAVMGFVGIVLSFALPFFNASWDQILVFALIVAVTMVVPGHIMNAQGRKLNAQNS
ncbi:MAG: hypothetical protein LIO85_04630 [Rikenellaceae bacterium]|nr:hypothetical protein [Rikenellaceae bacterium]